ncbi:sigma 54-interacting transcriptional regulator [Paraburkholderia bonniea]|uniref:sigma-54-dependent transcriptional regulator n=1 Tax=Paraburkholderia bonniea TaxID=2152891 RepID=UPI001292404A|nr:sigma 54-interacting transcriptional regulator [Paraburkholderia bonniea]WJF91428.1 sigma 54-interacting transcriptional regulator [Paraburkholderia bonniea]WJF94746.1 sigma 54-interacting transcriptional regulator [Paraburkholderia bonniea]
MPHALIIEDDPNSLSGLSALLSADDFSVASASTLAEARAALARFIPDVILVDLNLPDGSGLELLHSLPLQRPGALVPVIVMTGNATVESAIEGLRHGIWDYLVKPVDIPSLRSLLARVPRPHELAEEIHGLRKTLRQLGHFGPLTGKSRALQPVYDALETLAPTEIAVMIAGETGTGKKLTASTLHQLSRRRKGPLIVVDGHHLTAMHATRYAQAGHPANALNWFDEPQRMTGLHDARELSLLEQAHGGTLVVDGITAVPLTQQKMLLQALERQNCLRTSGTQPAPTDFRLVLTIDQAPRTAITDGLLDPELAALVEASTMTLAPLRERDGDAVLLAYAVLDELNHAALARDSAFSAKVASARLIQECMTYEWPGNVRELQQRVRAAYLAADDVLESLHANETHQMGSSSVQVTVGTALAEVEDLLIRATLEAVGGTRHRAASLLGISPKTLYNKLQRMQFGVRSNSPALADQDQTQANAPRSSV